MRFTETYAYRNAMQKARGDMEFVTRLSEASSPEQMLMLFELNGCSEKISSSMFLLLFGYMIGGSCENKKLIDNMIYIAENNVIFDKIFKLKLFWNTAGRWIKYNYSDKDKTMFQKLSIFLGIAAKKVLENNGK